MYNEYNTGALNAVGGKTSGMTMTVSTFQLVVCAIYAFLVWIVGYNPIKMCGLQAPEKQSVPKLTMGDVVKTVFYGKPPTLTKALCLPVIVGGVSFASLKKG